MSGNMTIGDPLAVLKSELEHFGRAHDAGTSEVPRRMLNITRDTGEFLAVLVRATAARRVLEIGTSNGYSTLWLAEAARATNGTVTTVECDDDKTRLASANFARSGLGPFMTQVQEDAGRFLQRGHQDSYDLVFLDSDRGQYCAWWPDLRRVLRPDGLLIVDNATSHAQQLAAFVELVNDDAEFSCCLVPVGKGEFLATRTPRRATCCPGST
jgi:predicted O-methyltransferase YrrM